MALFPRQYRIRARVCGEYQRAELPSKAPRANAIPPVANLVNRTSWVFIVGTSSQAACLSLPAAQIVRQAAPVEDVALRRARLGMDHSRPQRPLGTLVTYPLRYSWEDGGIADLRSPVFTSRPDSHHNACSTEIDGSQTAECWNRNE